MPVSVKWFYDIQKAIFFTNVYCIFNSDATGLWSVPLKPRWHFYFVTFLFHLFIPCRIDALCTVSSSVTIRDALLTQLESGGGGTSPWQVVARRPPGRSWTRLWAPPCRADSYCPRCVSRTSLSFVHVSSFLCHYDNIRLYGPIWCHSPTNNKPWYVRLHK